MWIPKAHQWIKGGTNFPTGRNYIHLLHTKYADLPTKARRSSGRDWRSILPQGMFLHVNFWPYCTKVLNTKSVRRQLSHDIFGDVDGSAWCNFCPTHVRKKTYYSEDKGLHDQLHPFRPGGVCSPPWPSTGGGASAKYMLKICYRWALFKNIYIKTLSTRPCWALLCPTEFINIWPTPTGGWRRGSNDTCMTTELSVGDVCLLKWRNNLYCIFCYVYFIHE